MFDAKAHWEKIYQEKRPEEVSWFQQDPAKSLELIHYAGIPKTGSLIDVGGGASRLVDKLLEEGYQNLSVLDISAQALDYAKQRLGPKAGLVHWIVADATNWTPDREYDLWHDRAVFHFLTEKAGRDGYTARVKSALRPGGSLILAAFAKDGPDKCSGLPVRQYDSRMVREEFGEGVEFVQESSETHRTPWGKEQKFGFFLLKRTAGR